MVTNLIVVIQQNQLFRLDNMLETTIKITNSFTFLTP